jgi:amylosucrase
VGRDGDQERRLLNQGIKTCPAKLERATWLNYVRCHDDIGLGFDDEDIRRGLRAAGRTGASWSTISPGVPEGFAARGLPFGENAKTGDARISGSLASLVGLESALEAGDAEGDRRRDQAILLLHSMILSFGGLPLLYYGDEIGTPEQPGIPRRPEQGGRQPLDTPLPLRLGEGRAPALSIRQRRAAHLRGLKK